MSTGPGLSRMVPDNSDVVLLPGIDDTAELFHDLQARLTAQGWRTHAPDLIPNNGDVGLDILAVQVATYIDNAIPRDRPFSIVGFSMGGLIARFYAQSLAERQRIRKLITISSPHYGTWTAFFRHNDAARQMRPGSSFLSVLNRNCENLRDFKFTSIWSPFDLMIIPARSSVVEEARSVRVNVAAHHLMMRDPRVLARIEAILAD